MPRSRKKGPYISPRLVEKILAMKQASIKRPIITYARSSTISPEMVDMSFSVHNGRGFDLVHITEEKVGHKLGEFSFTRTYRGHRQNDKKGKK